MDAVITTIIKRLAVIISVFAIAWCIIDPVFAEGETYAILEDCTLLCWGNWREFWASFSSPVRATVISPTASTTSNDNIGYCFVSRSPFNLSFENIQSTDNFACGVQNRSSIEHNGYYVFVIFGYTGDDHYNIPHVVDSEFNSGNQFEKAIYYTFGAGAVDPVVPITYGLLDDVGFTTDVAGTGNASTSNLDTISWNPVYDSNGNNIMGASVNIRAVPGHYSADSKQNLFEKIRSDFVLDMTDLAVLDTINVEEGSFSITWGQVISAFSIPFGNFISWFKTDEVFLKQGWIYQIQFTKGDYTSEWQTVYTIQSESPADSLHVINSTVIDQETTNILQQINTINNSTNIWIINETPVDPNDNYTPPTSDDEKPWWAYLLEMINNSIGITNKYINDGTDESQQVVNNIDTNNNDLDVTVNEYHDIENDLVTDMNDKVNDLDIEEDLTSDASFLSSARWVTEQFNTIVSNNPIGMILKFSLVLGFVTIFLGRFR